MSLFCTFRIVDEVSTVMIGVYAHHIQDLRVKFAEYAPGYRFTPMFKMGTWDGKIHFITNTGRTYQVLIPDIVKFLKPLGYKFRLDDQRAPLNISPRYVDDKLFADYNWILRPHQIASVNAIIDNGHRGIILAATSAGKTSICAAVSKVYGEIGFRTIVIVPSRDLIAQTVKQYEQLGIDVGQYSGTVKDLEHAHVISSWQALKNHPEIMLTFQVFICDEVQGAKGTVVSELLIKHGAHIPVRIGCTGTIPKEPADYKTIYAAIGMKEVYTITAKELQEQNLVATLHIVQMIMKDKLTPDEEAFLEYSHERDAINTNTERLQYIADFIHRTAQKDGNTLVLVTSISAGKKLAKLIGSSATFLYGKDDDITRQTVYASFADKNNLEVIANVQIAAVGLSINRILNLILVDLGKAFTRVIQSIGRGLRMAEDKSHVNVYDIGSDYATSSRHAGVRRQYYKEAQYPYEIKHIEYRVTEVDHSDNDIL